MARIEERTNNKGEKSYRVLIRIKGHPVETATFRRKTDAKRWAQEKESDIRAGRYFPTPDAKRRTLAELVDKFVAYELPQRRNDHQKVKKHLEWWKERLGELQIGSVTHIRINELKDELRNEKTAKGPYRSNHTINRYLSSLSICFTYAVDELGWIEDNPMRRVRKLKEPRGRDRFLSEDELKRLLNVSRNDTNTYIYLMVVLGLSSGMRWNEIRSLRWNQVDFRRQRVILTKTKNGECRTIPLVGPVWSLIQEHSKVRRLGSDYLFPQPELNKPAGMRKAWERVVVDAELTDFRFHDIRHTAASYLAMTGATLLEIAEILGHKTLQMVKRYAHLTEHHNAKVLLRMVENHLTMVRI